MVLGSRRARDRATANFISYEAVNQRILKARPYTKQAKISIIVAYAPTEDAEVDVRFFL